MKCPAREIMFQQKSRYLGDKWGGEVLEFLDASCGTMFHEKDGWGKIRLQRMYDRTKDIMSGVFVKYLAMKALPNIVHTVIAEQRWTEKGRMR